jgi:hypothetical protein
MKLGFGPPRFQDEGKLFTFSGGAASSVSVGEFGYGW